MRYIKRFNEELSPEIFKSAGNKLKELGQVSRGNKIYQHSFFKQKKFNLNIFCYDKGSILIDGDFHNSETGEYVGIKLVPVEAYFSHIKICYGGDDDKDYNTFINENCPISRYEHYMAVRFFFETTDGTVFELFQVVVNLYEDNENTKNENYKLDICAERPLDDEEYKDIMCSGGWGADRRTGTLLKKLVADTLLEDVNISEIISIFGITEHLERFTEDVEKMSPNLFISEIPKTSQDLN